jgi:AcrR family transcriptional regulator
MSTNPTPARTERSAITRSKIIRVAVKLFADRGIEGVSLNDINKAAGQRNKNATHYHFGSKEGLLQAVFDQHEPPIARRRTELLDLYQARGELTLRNVLRAILLPMAEKLNDPDGGPDFVRFSAHLVITNTMAALHLNAPTFRIASVERIAKAMDQQLAHLSPAIKVQRGLLLGVFLTHALAEHSRIRDNAQAGADLNRLTEVFVANLEDCLTALMQAPASEATLALLEDRA